VWRVALHVTDRVEVADVDSGHQLAKGKDAGLSISVNLIFILSYWLCNGFVRPITAKRHYEVVIHGG